MALLVDVISDVICPWCYIGKRRLEKAIAALDGPVKVRWLPFQLNAAMPKEGVSRREYRTKKFGSWERSQELDTRVVAVGEAEGIHFAFDQIERTPTTLDAHRLIGLAGRQGVQEAVVEALFRAYFTKGRDINNDHTPLDVVAETGLDRHEAEALLNGDDGLEAIKEAETLARRFAWTACHSSSSTARSRYRVPSSRWCSLLFFARRLARRDRRIRQRLPERASLRHRLLPAVADQQLLRPPGQHAPNLTPLPPDPRNHHAVVAGGPVAHPGDHGSLGPPLDGDALRPGDCSTADRRGVVGHGPCRRSASTA
jgi:predicted DsbA family dithiol-disulfide isomerase